MEYIKTTPQDAALKKLAEGINRAIQNLKKAITHRTPKEASLTLELLQDAGMLNQKNIDKVLDSEFAYSMHHIVQLLAKHQLLNKKNFDAIPSNCMDQQAVDGLLHALIDCDVFNQDSFDSVIKAGRKWNDAVMIHFSIVSRYLAKINMLDNKTFNILISSPTPVHVSLVFSFLEKARLLDPTNSRAVLNHPNIQPINSLLTTLQHVKGFELTQNKLDLLLQHKNPDFFDKFSFDLMISESNKNVEFNSAFIEYFDIIMQCEDPYTTLLLIMQLKDNRILDNDHYLSVADGHLKISKILTLPKQAEIILDKEMLANNDTYLKTLQSLLANSASLNAINVATAVVLTTLSIAAVGFGIGLAVGAWVGVQAFMAALLAGNLSAGAVAIASVGGGIGAFGLFKRADNTTNNVVSAIAEKGCMA